MQGFSASGGSASNAPESVSKKLPRAMVSTASRIRASDNPRRRSSFAVRHAGGDDARRGMGGGSKSGATLKPDESEQRKLPQAATSATSN